MTNISAAKIYEGKDKESENVVMVADSMSTMGQGGQKSDASQKLFSVNGSLIMHSGMRDAAMDVYQELKKRGTESPWEISKSIIEIVKNRGFPSNLPLDFIVSGFEKGGAKVHYVNATGFDELNSNVPSEPKGVSREQFYAFSGSGAPFANRIFEGQVDLGLDPRPRDVTSGLSLMRSIAQAATESSGVNDRLQYGVITPNGSHTLFHPSIGISDEGELSTYLKSITGQDYEKCGDFGTEQAVQARLANKPLVLMCRDFYDAFDLDLSLLESASRDFRTISDLFKESKVNLERVGEEKKIYVESKDIAKKAVSALLSRDAGEIAGYIVDNRKRREESYITEL
jgi:hypothetical protein